MLPLYTQTNLCLIFKKLLGFHVLSPHHPTSALGIQAISHFLLHDCLSCLPLNNTAEHLRNMVKWSKEIRASHNWLQFPTNHFSCSTCLFLQIILFPSPASPQIQEEFFSNPSPKSTHISLLISSMPHSPFFKIGFQFSTGGLLWGSIWSALSFCRDFWLAGTL